MHRAKMPLQHVYLDPLRESIKAPQTETENRLPLAWMNDSVVASKNPAPHELDTPNLTFNQLAFDRWPAALQAQQDKWN